MQAIEQPNIVASLATSVLLLPHGLVLDGYPTTRGSVLESAAVVMNILDFPPEIFQEIVHELVSALGVDKAWKLRQLCRKWCLSHYQT